VRPTFNPRYDKRAHSRYHPIEAPATLSHFDSLASAVELQVRPKMFLRLSILLIVISLCALCQNAAPAPVMRNTGEPLKVPFACAEDELQAVGLLCTEDDPCAVYLELAGVAIAGKKIFVAGNLHSSSATLSSILLSSDDSGATWQEPAARVRGTALEQVEFYDLDHGWAAGESQYPLPRDPFFLVSTDGGASWRRRPVTEDGGPGSLYKFWFDSAQHGELIVDAGKRAPSGRYFSYESETGGDSWMIRGTTNQLPKMKHAPAVFDNPDFRVRAAANGKAWLVEKRSAEKWETAASFLIEVAGCRLKAPEANEPPQEPVVTEAQEEKDYVQELKLGGGGQSTAGKVKPPAAKVPVKAPAKKGMPQ
jgi:hypothetical protein